MPSNTSNHPARRHLLLTVPALGAAGLITHSAVAAQPTPLHRVLGSGQHSLQVSALGLGCMGMSYHRSFIPERSAMLRFLRRAVDAGVTLFDTAEVYGPYRNEELVGEALAPVRKDILIATKFGFQIQNGEMAGLNSQPQHIRQVVDASLRRLRTDYIDLLYQHRVDPQVPIEDVAGVVRDLIAQGKVRRFGLSEASPANIRKAHQVQPLTAVQSEYSLMWRGPESAVLPVCAELGIGFVPYSPLCRGYLTGLLHERTRFNPQNDNRASLPRYQPDAIRANWPFIDLLANFGNARGFTVAQVALAWLLAQRPDVVPIPGTTKWAHLQENLASREIHFTTQELAELTAAASRLTVSGERYTGQSAQQVNN